MSQRDKLLDYVFTSPQNTNAVIFNQIVDQVVKEEGGGASSVSWGQIQGTLSNQIDLHDEFIQVNGNIQNVLDIANNHTAEINTINNELDTVEDDLAQHSGWIQSHTQGIANLNSAVSDLEATKQDELIAGTGISIVNNVISATGSIAPGYAAGDGIIIDTATTPNTIKADYTKLLQRKESTTPDRLMAFQDNTGLIKEIAVDWNGSLGRISTGEFLATTVGGGTGNISALGNVSATKELSAEDGEFKVSQTTSGKTIITGKPIIAMNLAAGVDLITLGDKSVTIGTECKATGDYSVAEGQLTQAKGMSTHSEGTTTISEGQNSHAEGEDTWAYADHSHTEGLGTVSYQSNQTIVGQYNGFENPSAYFIVGNGLGMVQKEEIGTRESADDIIGYYNKQYSSYEGHTPSEVFIKIDDTNKDAIWNDAGITEIYSGKDAFAVYQDGGVRFNYLSDGTTFKTATEILNNQTFTDITYWDSDLTSIQRKQEQIDTIIRKFAVDTVAHPGWYIDDGGLYDNTGTLMASSSQLDTQWYSTWHSYFIESSAGLVAEYYHIYEHRLGHRVVNDDAVKQYKATLKYAQYGQMYEMSRQFLHNVTVEMGTVMPGHAKFSFSFLSTNPVPYTKDTASALKTYLSNLLEQDYYPANGYTTDEMQNISTIYGIKLNSSGGFALQASRKFNDPASSTPEGLTTEDIITSIVDKITN